MAYVTASTLEKIDKIVQPIRKRGLEIISGVDNCKTVADIGCGIGTMSLQLSRALGPHCKIIGLDIDEDMVRGAIARSKNSNSDSLPSFLHGDAQHIPLVSAAVDVCWCERVLQHLGNPIAAINEMIRIIKPGGRLVIAESDWHSLSISYPTLSCERDFVESLSHLLQSPSIGRDLYGILNAIGLSHISVEAYPMVWTNAQDFLETSLAFPDLAESIHRATGKNFERVVEKLSAARNSSGFFSMANIVIVYGDVPLKWSQ